MKIGTQISLAFGAVLALVALIEGVALLGLSSANHGFEDYRRLAQEANVAGRVQANMLLVRLNAKEYTLSRSEAAAEEFERRFALLETMLEEAIAAMEDHDPEHMDVMRLIASSVEDYREGFAELAALLDEQDRIVAERLDPNGLAMRENLTSIVESAYADRDQSAAYLAGRVQEELLLGRLYVAKFLGGGREEDVAHALEKLGPTMEPRIAQLGEELQNPERRALFEAFVRARADYLGASRDIRELVREREAIIATRLDVIGPAIAEHAETVKLEIQEQQGIFEEAQLAVGRRSLAAFIVTALISAAGALVLGVVLVRAVKRPLGGEPAELEQAAREIADGDLGGPFASREGDTGIRRALAEMKGKLVTIVGDVSNTTAILAASGGIASGNAKLRSRTEEQAASVTETVSCMQAMTTMVKENARNALEASDLADSTRDSARAGGTIVQNAIDAMGEITTSSEKIGDIISVVNEISFQTNLLALNAAVEAARAGESGRGFAVVASEVRALAQRSAEAAGEIKALIEESVKKVDQGSALVNSSGATLEEIVASVQQVSDIVSTMEGSSKQQSVSIDEINQAMEVMDRMTQENADIVEEVTGASVSLEREIAQLARRIGFFSIEPKASSGVAS